MGIGKRIKEARISKGLTQEELARELGITKGAVANYENETSHPKEPVLYALIDTLGVDPNYLFQDCVSVLSNKNSPPLSDEEIKIAKDYRALDTHGKCMVRLVIAEELKHTVSRKGIVTLPTAFQRVHPGIRGLDDDNDPKTNMVSVPARNGGLVYWALSEKQFAQYNALVMQENEESAADDV